MHPYEWGILGVKALDFYPLFGCTDCSHCSWLWKLLWQHRHQLRQLSHRTWVAIAKELSC
jgi:hypothetical protein